MYLKEAVLGFHNRAPFIKGSFNCLVIEQKHYFKQLDDFIKVLARLPKLFYTEYRNNHVNTFIQMVV